MMLMDENGRWVEIPDGVVENYMHGCKSGSVSLYDEAIAGREYWLDENYCVDAFGREFTRGFRMMDEYLAHWAAYQEWLDGQG